MVQSVQAVQNVQAVQSKMGELTVGWVERSDTPTVTNHVGDGYRRTTSSHPPTAMRELRDALNGLNDWNVLNDRMVSVP